uniref:Uncharacterized protein n=1 Tax=Opuntia streptacantha TaxID=393608 RepID=A0A7C9DUV6_OPUST
MDMDWHWANGQEINWILCDLCNRITYCVIYGNNIFNNLKNNFPVARPRSSTTIPCKVRTVGDKITTRTGDGAGERMATRARDGAGEDDHQSREWWRRQNSFQSR